MSRISNISFLYYSVPSVLKFKILIVVSNIPKEYLKKSVLIQHLFCSLLSKYSLCKRRGHHSRDPSEVLAISTTTSSHLFHVCETERSQSDNKLSFFPTSSLGIKLTFPWQPWQALSHSLSTLLALPSFFSPV